MLAAVLHTEIDVYGSIVTRNSFGLTVNLSLDHSGPLAEIESERSETAKLTVRPKVHDNVMIRIPL